ASDLVNNFARVATLLSPSGIGNNAERAKFVAAFDNWHKGDERRVSFQSRAVPHLSMCTLAKVDDRFFPFLNAFDQGGNAISGAGSDNHVHVWCLGENGFPF